MTLHKTFCSKDIPIIECIGNLEKLKKKDSFSLLGQPQGGLESFIIRAVAFEPINET